MTVLETLNAAADYLRKHGVESPRLNAEHLLAHSLGKKRLDLYLEFDRPLTDAERAPLRETIKKRGAGVPLQHLLGTAEFCGRTFLCDARGLIPRPETEQLIEIAKERGPFPTILDIGAGSGVIAITLALEMPAAQVSAIDLSSDALALARENAFRLEADIAFHQGDLLPDGATRYHLIAANLPYIPTAEIASLQREVRHDPATALDGGADGLDLVRRLIEIAPNHLQSGGLLLLEIGHDQSAAVADLLKTHNFGDIQLRQDYQGISRFALATYG